MKNFAGIAALVAVLGIAAGIVWYFKNDDLESDPQPARPVAEKVEDVQPATRKSTPTRQLLPEDATKEPKDTAVPVAEKGPETKVTGRVLTEAGQPIADAEVTLFMYTRTDMAREGRQRIQFNEDVRAKVKTSATGAYEFADLVDVVGTPFSMVCRAKGYVPMIKDRIGPGITVDFRLDPGSVVTGRILDVDTGKGIPDVAVEYNRKNNAASLHDYFRWREVVKTNADGQYSIDGGATGEVTVYLIHEDYEETFFGADHKIVLSNTAPNELDFEMKRGITIDGLVVDATDRTKVIKDADVILRGSILPSDRQRTGALGKFRMKGVKRGSQMIEIRANGYSRLAESIDINDRDFAKPVVFAMKPCGLASGTVVDANGAPVVGAEIYVAERTAMFMKVRDLAETKTDANGRFAITNLNDGATYNITASAPGWTLGSSTNFEASTGRETTDIVVQLERGARVQGKVTDEIGAPLADVHVTIEQPPYAEAWFPPGLTSGQKNSFTVVTDATGIFSVDGLYKGTYFISPEHPNYIAVTGKKFQVTAGNESINQDFSLKQGHSISGQVRDQFGNPMKGVTVTAANFAGDNRKFTAVTDEKGNYALRRLLDQNYRLRAESNDGISRPIPDVPSDSTGIDFVVEKYGRLIGRVAGRDGLPITSFKVRLTPILVRAEPDQKRDLTSPEVRKAMMTDEAYRDIDLSSSSGEFTIDRVPPGEYNILVRCESHREQDYGGIMVNPGEDVNVKPFALVEGARLEGFLRDSTGAPVANGKIQIRVSATPDSIRQTRVDAATGSTTTTNMANMWEGRDTTNNSEGFYTLGGLPPGKVRVSFYSTEYCCPAPFESAFGEGVTKKDYTVRRAAKISIRVKDEDGKGIASPSCVVTNPDGTNATVDGHAVQGRGDSTGLLKVEKLEPGNYEVRVNRLGYDSVRLSVTVAEGEEFIEEVKLKSLR